MAGDERCRLRSTKDPALFVCGLLRTFDGTTTSTARDDLRGKETSETERQRDCGVLAFF